MTPMVHVDGDLISLLSKALPGQVREGVPLSSVSRWRIGGPAAVLVEPRSTEEAARLMAIMAERPEPLFIMGDGSNMLFDDAGFSGVVMRIGRTLSSFRISSTQVWSQAGAWVPRLASAVGAQGLSGLEHTIGIPGTLGGLIVMNGGSQRKGIGLNVREVLCADEFGNLFRLDGEECGFSYRTSALQSRRVAVLEATLELNIGDRKSIRAEMLKILRERSKKFPRKQANCGSTFLSNPVMYAHVGPPGKAIEDAGLKGLRRGGARFSPLHANFVVNEGDATAADVLWLIAKARRDVSERTGYLMDSEVRYLNPDGQVVPAHVAAEQLWPKTE